MSSPVIREKLAFESRDVYTNGAFGLAGPAFETQVEHLKNPSVAQAGLFETAGHRQAERVRTTACRVFLLERRTIRRAHCPLELFAARAHSAAHFNSATHSSMRAVVKECRRVRRAIRRAVTQVVGDGWRIYDFAGIEESVRIERPLDLSES